MITKHCYTCKETKPISNFAKDKNRKSGHTYNCKVCRKLNRDKQKKKIKNGNLKYSYGISLKEYSDLEKKQNGRCAICGQLEIEKSSRNKYLAVDHCHVTNKIRGLLCTTCNRALGLFGDTTELLKKAIKYLEEFDESVTSVN